jgi:hypothetical protein
MAMKERVGFIMSTMIRVSCSGQRREGVEERGTCEEYNIAGPEYIRHRYDPSLAKRCCVSGVFTTPRKVSILNLLS